jgi:hypothetical protein
MKNTDDAQTIFTILTQRVKKNPVLEQSFLHCFGLMYDHLLAGGFFCEQDQQVENSTEFKTCVACGKKIYLLDIFSPVDDPAQACWDGGIVEWVTAGYGSRHDMDKYLICLCDDCVSGIQDYERNPKTKDGVVVYAGMPLYKKGLDDGTMTCHADVRATWIDWEGRTFVDDVGNYYSEPQE